VITDLQLTLGREEFDQLTKSLKVALDNHLDWLSELNFTMICQPENLKDFCNCQKPYRQCKFGLWYYSVDNENIINHPLFEELGREHKVLHRSVCDLVKSAESTAKPEIKVYQYFKEAEYIFLKCLKSILHQSLEANANTDFLTGLPNRQALDLVLKQEHARIKRNKVTGSLLILDIDFFKDVNDTYGHLIGDQVLKIISNLITENVRGCDFTARYGGEEFIIYFPETSSKSTAIIAEKLRSFIEAFQIELKNNTLLNITCSFGISSFVADKAIKQIIANADVALYKAKDEGRNRVIICENSECS